MRFKGIPYERINIKINKTLYSKLNDRALSEFVTKSELVRNWIIEDINLHIKGTVETSNDSAYFNFRIDIPTLNKLKKICKVHEISKSSYIRLLIINKLKPLESKVETVPQNLLKENNYYETKRYLENKKHTTNTELVNLINVNTHLGLFNKALNFFNEYQDRKNKIFISEETQLLAELSKVKIDLYIKCLPNIINDLEDLNRRALLLQNRKILGEVNLLKGEFFRSSSQLEKSIVQYESALEYLDVINYPQEVTDAYIRKAIYYQYQSNYPLVNKYLNKAEVLSNKTGNKYQLTHIYNIRSICNSFDKLKESVGLSTLSLSTNKKIRSTLGEIFDLESLTRYSINLRNYDNAYKLIELVENKLKLGQVGFDLVQMDLCKIFIESFTNYNDSLSRLNLLKNSGIKNIRQISCDYVSNAIKYINGKNPYDQHSSEINLKKLMANKSYPLFQKAAQYTLENKNLYLYF